MIKLIYFLSVELLFVLFLVHLNRKYFNSKLSNFKMAMIASFVFYLSILAIVFVTNYLLRKELDSFDLNGDHNFSIEERTSEQQKAMHHVIADTGRHFALIFGILYSLIYFLIIILPLALFNKPKNIQ